MPQQEEGTQVEVGPLDETILVHVVLPGGDRSDEVTERDPEAVAAKWWPCLKFSFTQFANASVTVTHEGRTYTGKLRAHDEEAGRQYYPGGEVFSLASAQALADSDWRKDAVLRWFEVAGPDQRCVVSGIARHDGRPLIAYYDERNHVVLPVPDPAHAS